MSIGIPVKILHEAEGHTITLETVSGEVYRGKLVEAEDNMNCQMTGVNVTYRDGRTAHLQQIFIRGSKVRFIVIPDMLKNAPMFKKTSNKAELGKSAILKAQAAARGRGGGRGDRGGRGSRGRGGGVFHRRN